MFHLVFYKIFFQPVGNIPFGDSPHIKLCLGICELDAVILDHNIVVAHMLFRGAYFLFGRNGGLFGMKIPEIRHGADGDVKNAVGQLAVVDPFFQEGDRVLGHLHKFAFCAVNAGDVALFVGF